MKVKLSTALGFVSFCSLLTAALPAADSTPATPPPNFTFVDAKDPAVATIVDFGSKSIERVGAALVAEVTRELATKETSLAVNVLHLKNLELPKPVAGLPVITAIKRTSLLVRNHLNTPDAADKAALDIIQSQVEDGDAPSRVLVQRIEHPGAPVEWRVYRPIAASQSCLACHGDPATFQPGVKAALDLRYPEDKATGYTAQSWRGVIRVSMIEPAPAVKK